MILLQSKVRKIVWSCTLAKSELCSIWYSTLSGLENPIVVVTFCSSPSSESVLRFKIRFKAEIRITKVKKDIYLCTCNARKTKSCMCLCRPTIDLTLINKFDIVLRHLCSQMTSWFNVEMCILTSVQNVRIGHFRIRSAEWVKYEAVVEPLVNW